MAQVTVPIHALQNGDKFLDDDGTAVVRQPKTGSDLPQGYVVVGLEPGGDKRFFGDVEVEIERA